VKKLLRTCLAAWFQKMQMPCDYITPVELEGERGVVKEVGA
jgi:hypothetical protein